jgi:hypothetical protein
MRELQQRDRDIRRSQARAEGRRLELEPTEQEQELLNTQREEYMSDWSESRQEQFKSEQSHLWNLIPEQFRGRAEHLAKGGM